MGYKDSFLGILKMVFFSHTLTAVVMLTRPFYLFY